ncbi:GtrA family protein [Geodermatophilus sp. YIM 151500]|uniref:GtrA family protein n=1 Tax=Geodermatophilus sp. YIM 151500 TaxID=2984531 RepID=UPI0021E47F53|nr:GtrA family protein [Geodermatophilus sp. YIM 151500]MCV2490316.1 GtrA family protein [Geodermatophilus sp. YIM 151500]
MAADAAPPRRRPLPVTRFLLAGGLANVLYAVLFLSLAPLGGQPANLAGAVASSTLANELHRRSTFRAGARVGWLTAQWAGSGIALAGWAMSAAALGVLEAAVVDPSPATGAVLVLSVTATVGLVRFIALRWVFRPARPARPTLAGAA